MPQQIINIGLAADDGTGDKLRAAGQKINGNFTELYEAVNDIETVGAGLPDIEVCAANIAAIIAAPGEAADAATSAGAAAADAADAENSALLAQAYGISVYETLHTDYGVLVLDAGGRIYARVPDPQTAINTAALAAAATVAMYETLHTDYGVLILDAGGRIVASAGTGTATAADIATINARVNSVVTTAGAPLLNPYGREFIRNGHMRLTKRALGESTQLIINLIGDSYTHNTTRYSGDLTARLIAKFGDAGGGWCGFGFLQSGNVAPWTSGNQPNYTNGNVRPATYSTRLYGNIVGGYYTNATPDLALATLSAAGDAIEQDFPATPVLSGVDLFFVGTAAGQIRYQWSGGAWTTINVQGTVGATQTVALAGYPAGAGTLRIEWVAGTVQLCGVNLKSAADGVRVNKLAATGSNIGHWTAVNAPNWQAGITALGAHLTTILDGTNSQGASMGAGTWGNNVDTMVARLRAATPGVDILLTTPPENQRAGNTVPMTAYATEARTRAMNDRIAYYDFQNAFGDPANPTEYGSAGAFPVFNADLIHPDPPTGGRILLFGFEDIIVPYRGI